VFFRRETEVDIPGQTCYPRTMKAKVLHSINLREGGATAPTVNLYQLASGRCRVWWFALDQDGQQSETITTFHEKDWHKAIKRGMAEYKKFKREAGV